MCLMKFVWGELIDDHLERLSFGLGNCLLYWVLESCASCRVTIMAGDAESTWVISRQLAVITIVFMVHVTKCFAYINDNRFPSMIGKRNQNSRSLLRSIIHLTARRAVLGLNSGFTPP